MTQPDLEPDWLTGTKVVRTFRMPPALVDALGKEANQRGLDLTALVTRILHGYLTYSGLPEAAAAQLEADRQALRMDRNQYLAHLLFHRCLDLRERGPGFDDPHRPEAGSFPAADTAATGPERQAAPGMPLGSAGGGAHRAGQGMVPGAGVWPYGPRNRNSGR
jgi:hypothetical protein